MKTQQQGMNATQRMEKDSLGLVSVPASALYGAQTARAVHHYPISGRTAHPALTRAYLRIKCAAARVNEGKGVLSSELSRLIQQAIQNILERSEADWPTLFPVDPYQAGAGTSQNMNVNEVIANLANQIGGKELGSYHPVHPNDHVNRSQSTNDTFPTAMRLAILDVSRALGPSFLALSETLLEKAKAWKHLPKSGRTHLQDAVPMTLGQEFEAYGFILKRCAEWIEEGRNALRELGIGGSAIGTALTVPAGYSSAMVQELQHLTGETLSLAASLCAATQSQSPVMYYASHLRLCALEMTRVCNDLRLLASGPMTGLAEILLPSVQPGSSIMPGKVNPSILEMANQTWFSVLGYEQTVAYCTQAGQLELNVMMPMMAYSMLEATQVAIQANRILKDLCLDGLKPNESRLRKYFENTPQVATALSPLLGYEKTAQLVQEALQKGVSVIDLVREKQLLSETDLKKCLDLGSLTGVQS